MTSASTLDVVITTTRPTVDLPEFTRIVAPIEVDPDEIIQDGLSLQADLGRYRNRASTSLPELDAFFDSLE